MEILSKPLNSRDKYRILFSCFFLLITYVGHTQIVNIENQRLSSKQDGWSGSVDLNFTVIKNTNVLTQFGNRNRVNYHMDQHNWMLLTDFGLVKANGSDLINTGFAHLRYSYNLHRYPKIYLEAFSQAQYNKIQLVDLRLLNGAGARFEVVKLDSFALNLGAFLMHEYERQTDDIVNSMARYSCFLSFDYQFSKTTGINSITYYQPGFLSPDDFRISSETSLRFVITKKVSFRVVYNLFYDAYPPEGVPTTTYYFNNSIVIRF